MILLLNCSFRGEKSNSNYFLDRLAALLEEEYEKLQLSHEKDTDQLAEKWKHADAVVLGMPLYVDGAPAQVVEMMENLYAEYQGAFGKLPVYVISNLGFYESRQIEIQLEIVKNWCEKMGMTYAGGLAIGAGEMMGELRNVPLDQGPNKQTGEGMKRLADAISSKNVTENIFVEPSGFPRRLYKLCADMSWNKWTKINQLPKGALYQKRV